MHEAKRTAFVSAILVNAAVLAFFIQPLFRFTEPGGLAIAGASIAIGASSWWLAYSLNWHWSAHVGYGLLFLVGVLGVAGLINSASGASRRNDRRCIAIQRDMLSAKPRRSDGPDLFQALGCRPQGDGSVYAPSVARRGPK